MATGWTTVFHPPRCYIQYESRWPAAEMDANAEYPDIQFSPLLFSIFSGKWIGHWDKECSILYLNWEIYARVLGSIRLWVYKYLSRAWLPMSSFLFFINHQKIEKSIRQASSINLNKYDLIFFLSWVFLLTEKKKKSLLFDLFTLRITTNPQLSKWFLNSTPLIPVCLLSLCFYMSGVCIKTDKLNSFCSLCSHQHRNQLRCHVKLLTCSLPKESSIQYWSKKWKAVAATFFLNLEKREKPKTTTKTRKGSWWLWRGFFFFFLQTWSDIWSILFYFSVCLMCKEKHKSGTLPCYRLCFSLSISLMSNEVEEEGRLPCGMKQTGVLLVSCQVLIDGTRVWYLLACCWYWGLLYRFYRIYVNLIYLIDGIVL